MMDKPKPRDGGLLDSLRDSMAGFMRYAHALAMLAGKEGKDAAAHYGRTAAIAVVALVFGGIGYLLVLAAFTVALCQLEITPLGICIFLLVLGLMHIAVALIGIRKVKKRIVPVFEITRSELRRDLEALKHRHE